MGFHPSFALPVVALAVCFALGLGAGPDAAAAATRHPAALPSQVHVDALDDFFRRSVVRIRRGATVTWDFTGTRTHTATDGTGMDLYDSGLASPGDPSFSYTFEAAGVYRFTCTLHAGMNGRAEIPMRVRPVKDAPGSRFSAIWSSVGASPGSVFDVQVKRKGHEWKTWKEGVAAAEGSYRADRRGTYLFRARMRDDGSLQSSDWSEAESVRAV